MLYSPYAVSMVYFSASGYFKHYYVAKSRRARDAKNAAGRVCGADIPPTGLNSHSTPPERLGGKSLRPRCSARLKI